MISDEDLMASTAQGDTSAFEQIVLRYQDAIWRVACRFTGNPVDAQDITQTAFLKLFEAAPRYQPRATLKTYLFKIVHTTCIDYSRKHRPGKLDDPTEVLDDSPSAIDALMVQERYTALKQAIESLPLRQRSAILLRYEANLSIREISNILPATEKAVERLLARGRNALSTILKDRNHR